MKDYILFIWIFCVTVVAIAVIYRNRKQNQSKKPIKFREYRHQQEPILENNMAGYDENFDPVVDTYQQRPEKIHYAHLPTETKKPAPPKQEINKVDPARIQRAQHFFPSGVITIMLISEIDKPYTGYELLQALLSAGLRYGKHNIFHRHQSQQLNNPGQILFSLASAIKPGTFEMPKMGGFNTEGLVMFMQVAEQNDSLEVYDLMLETAYQLIDDLKGEIWDENRRSLTEEKIAETRNKLKEFEASFTTADLFQTHEN